ncbi:unnamed protein product, partial [Clonostachys solani]
LKCDGAKPACKACLAKGKECIPQTPTQQPRPTNRRIKELEEENQRLRQLLQETQKDRQETNVSSNHSSSSAQVALESTQRQWSTEDSLEPPASSSREELGSETSPSLLAEAPQMNQASYHGPTSVLFDNLSRLNVKGSDEDFPTSDSHNIRCMLVAESAKQRMYPISLICYVFEIN